MPLQELVNHPVDPVVLNAHFAIPSGKVLTMPVSLTLTGIDNKVLTVNGSVTLGGTDGKSLILNGSLSISADTQIVGGGIFNLNGFTITAPDSGTILLADPSTLELVMPSEFSVNGTPITIDPSIGSVALVVPPELIVSGSPVVDSGTLTVVWASVDPHKALMGPASGGAASPGFRNIELSDLPAGVGSPGTVNFGSSFPVSPITGQIYFRTDLSLPCVYNGLTWQALFPHWVQPQELWSGQGDIWHFNMLSGNTQKGVPPNSTDLSATNATSFARYESLGERGRSLRIDATLFIAPSSNLTSRFGNFTTASGCLWIKMNAVDPDHLKTSTLMSNDSNTTRGWIWDAVADASNLGYNLRWSNGTTTIAATDTIGVVLAEGWYFCFWVYDTGTIDLYVIDGLGTERHVASGACTVGTKQGAFVIGQNANTDAQNPFDGSIAAPKIWGLYTSDAALREYIWLCEAPLFT